MDIDPIVPEVMASEIDEALDAQMNVDSPTGDTSNAHASLNADGRLKTNEVPNANATPGADITPNAHTSSNADGHLKTNEAPNANATPSADITSNAPETPNTDKTLHADNTPTAPQAPNAEITPNADETPSSSDSTQGQSVSTVFTQTVTNRPVPKLAPIKYINGMTEYEWEKAENIKKNKKLLVSLGLDNVGKHVFGKHDKENTPRSKSKRKVGKALKSNVEKRPLRSTGKRGSDR
jgi:hypothetical protein